MYKIIFLMLVTGMIGIARAEDIRLPEPNKTGKTTLMQALEDRHSDHAFSDQDLDDRTLGTILWAAYGVNRDDGKRTIPTAMNQKDLDVYVFNRRGIWLYEADNHVLKQISDQNRLDLFQKQDYMAPVPVVLVYVGGSGDYAPMHAGSAYQNVGLFTAANNMASIVRGYFERDKVAEVLNLKPDQRVIISQAVGVQKN